MRILIAISSFISTNLDDLLVLILISRTAETREMRVRIAAGQFLGIFTLVGISLLAAHGIAAVSAQWLRFLGLIPIFLGVRAAVAIWKPERDAAPVCMPGVLSVAALAIANGGDNLGVYISIFGNAAWRDNVCTVLIYAAMIPLWCLLAGALARMPAVAALLERYGTALTAVVFLAIGLSILL